MVLSRLEPGRVLSERKQVAKLRKASDGKSAPLEKMKEHHKLTLSRF